MSIWEISPVSKVGEVAEQSEKKSEVEKEIVEKEVPEHIHTKEEVLALFEEIIGEDKFEDIRVLEDEQGLYLWEIKIPQSDGGNTEYSYVRKGDYKARGLAGGSVPETAINVIYFDADGDYIHGTHIKKFLKGAWKDTPADEKWQALMDKLKKENRG